MTAAELPCMHSLQASFYKSHSHVAISIPKLPSIALSAGNPPAQCSRFRIGVFDSSIRLARPARVQDAADE